ncbi:MAG: fumarate hydratase, partial [Planctomycetaceae bacterium]
MSAASFSYEPLFQLSAGETPWRLLTAEHVEVQSFQGERVLCVASQALTLLSSQAFHDINFFLRPAHLKQVAAILDDPEASENDRMVALTML